MACYRGWLIVKTKLVESSIQPIAGTVTGEVASGSVSAMSCWSEANNQKPRSNKSKTWDRPSPVFPIAKTFNFVTRYSFPIFHQARASAAVNNLTLGRQLGHSEWSPSRRPEKTWSQLYS